MQCHDHPQHAPIADPYPADRLQVAGFSYASALVLVRLKDAPARRNGQDADYIVGRPYLCRWTDQHGAAHDITVPAGMITDLTSVPWLLQSVVGRVGPWLEAAIVHDFLYLAWQDIPDGAPRDSDRAFADDIMKAAMEAAKVGMIRRTLIITAVRLFGRATYFKRDTDRYVDLHDPEVGAQVCPGGLHLPGDEDGLPLS